jgi:thiamine monophosphate kinase
MIKFTAALLAGAMVATPAMAAPAAPAAKPAAAKASTALPPVVIEAMRPIRQFLDGINAGNIDSAMAAYVHGDITITDEFAPHVWMGPDAPHAWLDDYAKDSAAKG